MPGSNLDAVKRRYNIKDIRIATWRDPALSVHPARRRPGSPVSPEAAKAFVPTYRVRYDPIEPTDEEDDGQEEIEKEEPADTSSEPPEDKPIEELETPAEPSELDPPSTLPESVKEAAVDSPVEAAEAALSDQIICAENVNDSPQEDNIEGAILPDKKEIIDSSELPSEEVIADQPIDPASEIEGPVAADASPAEDAPVPADMEAGLEDMPGQDNSNAPADDESDERRVSFAPGTPDPAPRKKKSAKGTKGKKKKTVIPAPDLPADVLAMLEGDFAGLGLPPPPPPPPVDFAPLPDDAVVPVETKESIVTTNEPENAPGSEAGVIEIGQEITAEASTEAKDDTIIPESNPEDLTEKALDDSVIHPESASNDAIVKPSDTTDSNSASAPDPRAILDAPSEDAPKDNPPTEFSEAPPVSDSTVPEAKKKSSKSSKEKSKKKSSKKKSESVDPFPAGLGIDLPPPIPDLDDILKDLGPPGSWDKPNDVPGNDFTAPVSPFDDAQPPEVANNEPEIEKTDETPLDDLQTVMDADADPPSETKEHGGSAEPSAVGKSESTTAKEGASDAVDGGNLAEAGSPVDSGVDIDGASDGASEGTGEDDKPEDFVPSEAVIQDDGNTEDAASDDTTETGEEELPEAKEKLESDEGPIGEADSEAPPTEPEPTDTDGDPKGSKDADEDSGDGEVADEASEQPESSSEVVPEVVDSLIDEAAPAEGAEQSKDNQPPEGHIEALPEAEVSKEENPPEQQESARIEEPTNEAEVPKDAEPVSEEVAKSDSPPVENGGEIADPPQDNAKDEPLPEAPPSPDLSKTSSGGSSKRTHWERPHAESKLNGVFQNSKVLEKQRGSKRSSGGKEEIRVRDRRPRDRKETAEEAEARRQRRRERKAREAAEAEEVERKRREEERERRIRHEERKAAKLEEKARMIREQARAATDEKNDEEPRRRRRGSGRSGRDSERPGSSRSDAKLVLPTVTTPTWSKFGLGGGESTKGRRQAATSSPTSSRREARETDADAKTASSSGRRSHRHHHSRSEEQRSSRGGEHRSRRSMGDEQRSGGLFSSLFRRS